MRDYQQEVRDLIFSRETEGKAIWEIGLLIEKIIREQYVAVVTHPTLNLYQVVGPYGTENQLRKDYGKRIHSYDSASYARLAKLVHPDNITL